MKYFEVHFIDFNDYQVHIKQCFTNQNEAIINLENIAVEYIRELQGKQQADICKQYDTPIEKLSELDKGLYLHKDGNNIYLYEKKEQHMSGIFSYYHVPKVEKIGLFGIAEFEIETVQNVSVKKMQHKEQHNFISELNSVLKFSQDKHYADIFNQIKENKKKNLNETNFIDDEEEYQKLLSDDELANNNFSEEKVYGYTSLDHGNDDDTFSD
jgi:hypothetical protein